MKRPCSSRNDDSTQPGKRPNNDSLTLAVIPINRQVEVAEFYFKIPKEIHWRIFSNCSEDNYKSLLNFSCISTNWNKIIIEYIVHWKNFENQSLDHCAALCGNPSNLEYDPNFAPKDLYSNKLAQIYARDETQILKIFLLELGVFNRENTIRTNIFYHQLRFIKIAEYYLFSDQLLIDIKFDEIGEEDSNIGAVLKFLIPFKASILVRTLMTRLMQHVNASFIEDPEKQSALSELSYHLIRNRLVNFDQVKPFILHITPLLDPDNKQSSRDIMQLLNMCIMSLFEETVTFLNKETAYKNTVVEALIAQVIRGNKGTKNIAFELLRNMKQYHCLKSEQNEIIIKHLGTQNWVIDILLLIRLGHDATSSKALYSKITFQFANQIYEGLRNLDLNSKTIHEDFFISSGLLIHTVQLLEHLFQLFLQGTSIDDNVRNELKKIVLLLCDIEYTLNVNPMYARRKESDSEVDNSEEVSDSEVTDSEIDAVGVDY